jgi:RNA polymerase sigma-70 factor (ECF subfamily)
MRNDEAAELIDALFGDWGPNLVRYAYRVTRSREIAEDLVQEVFMALYRDLVSGKRIDNVKGWTLNAVRNQISKQARYRERHREELQPHERMDLMPSAQPFAAGEEEQGDIGDMLRVLTRREEEVILLRMQALKYREIGAQLGISHKTVNALIARALEKLQRFAATRSATPVQSEANARQTLQ